jgi:hypothetical protein
LFDLGLSEGQILRPMTKNPEISLNIRLMVIYLFYNNANAPAGAGDLRGYN